VNRYTNGMQMDFLVLTWVVIVVSVSVEVVTVAVSRDTREIRSLAESALYITI